MHWRRKWQPIPVFLPGESQGRGSPVGGRLWVRTELDTTERLHFHFHFMNYTRASLVAQTVNNLPAMQKTWVRSLGWEDPLVHGMATHSSILAWRISLTGKPGRLQSMGLQRVGQDWVANHSAAHELHTVGSCRRWEDLYLGENLDQKKQINDTYLSFVLFLLSFFLKTHILWARYIYLNDTCLHIVLFPDIVSCQVLTETL